MDGGLRAAPNGFTLKAGQACQRRELKILGMGTCRNAGNQMLHETESARITSDQGCAVDSEVVTPGPMNAVLNRIAVLNVQLVETLGWRSRWASVGYRR